MCKDYLQYDFIDTTVSGQAVPHDMFENQGNVENESNDQVVCSVIFKQNTLATKLNL